MSKCKSNIKTSFLNPFAILGILLIIISFAFAKESKIDLLMVAGITVSLIFTMSLINRESSEIEKTKHNVWLELFIYLAYFVLYLSWSFINSIHNYIPSDEIDIILLLFIPYIISKMLGYKATQIGFSGTKFIKLMPKTLVLCAIIAIFYVPWLFIPDMNKRSLNALSEIITFLFVFVIVYILSALPEEFFFRAILQTKIEKCAKNPITAIVLSSLIFALFHVPYRLYLSNSITKGNLLMTLCSVLSQQFLIGLFLAVWWKKTRNVLSVSFVHAFYNAFLLLDIIKISI